jgi:LPXTG-motif cell wall-anchored protein
MHTPQIIMIILIVLGVGVDLERHGKPKTGEHNIGWSLFGAAVTVALLWWGGFFAGH